MTKRDPIYPCQRWHRQPPQTDTQKNFHKKKILAQSVPRQLSLYASSQYLLRPSKDDFPTTRLLSVVVPARNEEQVLPEFHKRLSAVLEAIPLNAEVIYVNDGSTDRTLEIMLDFQQLGLNTAIVDLSRNYGKEIALTAGLDHATGDAVVIIDADLQDPPELIPELIREWTNGYDVVYAKRISRQGEGFLKKFTAFLFYRIIQKLSHVTIPEDTGDYRLLSRRALEALKQLREQHRFMKGLFSWIGFLQTSVPYHRDPRHAGKTKWNYWGLWNFALEGITSFTIAPLKLSTYLGLATALGCFSYALVVVLKTVIFGDPVRGWPSQTVVILFLGGIQLIGIGIIGEYLGRIFNETKHRPLYFLNGYYPNQPRPIGKQNGRISEVNHLRVAD